MRGPRRNSRPWPFLLPVLAAGVGCGGDDPGFGGEPQETFPLEEAGPSGPEEAGSLTPEKLRAVVSREAPSDTGSAPAPPPTPTTVPSERVEGWTGPGGEPFEVAVRTAEMPEHLHRRIGRRTFPLPLRLHQPELTQYPCSSCHAPGVPPVDPEPRTEDAHGDIQPVHPEGRGEVCTTCHVSEDVERLAVHGGEPVGMTHAYRVCAECHSTEVEAWAGGSHGKQVDHWERSPRVVMGCADCHDPHAPTLEPRIPYPGPRLPDEDDER